jgi:hypothetical protein
MRQIQGARLCRPTTRRTSIEYQDDAIAWSLGRTASPPYSMKASKVPTRCGLPATQSRKEKRRRLFILEDIEPDYVDALGHHLGVDPMVFSEQMNTWNFTDSWSIPFRGLPSMSVPGHSFTLRYYELRTLFDPASVEVLSMQFSFAINRRRYERWRDIDVPSLGKPDRRHAFVRRCASFWTSQDVPTDEDDEVGWDGMYFLSVIVCLGQI